MNNRPSSNLSTYAKVEGVPPAEILPKLSSISTMLPTTTRASTQPTRNAVPLLLARCVNSIKMTAIMGTGLMATPMAMGRILPRAFPMSFYFLMNQMRKPGCGKMLFCRIPCTTLLSRHNKTHLGFRVPDQLAADIYRHPIDLAGELERRGVLGRDGQTGIGATGQATWVEEERRRIREIGVSDQFAIDVEL